MGRHFDTDERPSLIVGHAAKRSPPPSRSLGLGGRLVVGVMRIGRRRVLRQAPPELSPTRLTSPMATQMRDAEPEIVA